MICLIRPPAVEAFRLSSGAIWLPLGLAYVAAAIEKAGHRVQVIDGVAAAPTRYRRYFKGVLLGIPLDEIAARVPADCELVGISVIFTHEWPAVVRLIELLKRDRPGCRVVIGGEHVTALPEFCLLTSRADMGVCGEGEETIVELIATLAGGGSLGAVDGLCWRDGDHVVVNRRRDRVADVDSIAPPAWHLFDVQAYAEANRALGVWSDVPAFPMLATRGCPYQCTYCSSPNTWTTRWIPRNPVKVVDEMQRLHRDFGAGHFWFEDLTAIVRKDWIVAFCRELLNRRLDITWQLPVGTRSEAIDEEVAELLRATRMKNMAYAPESGSQETRRIIKKMMHEDRLFGSIAAASRHDLDVTIFLVLGFPHDSPDLVRATLPFYERLARAGVTDVSISFYVALPGTQLFDSLDSQGRIRLDQEYFTHLLDSLNVIPFQSYSQDFHRLTLAWWKLRIYWHFYSRKLRHSSRRLHDSHHKGGLWASGRDALAGLRGRGGNSKLQAALRNMLLTAWRGVKARFRPRWMSREAERRLFEAWPEIHCRIRQERRRQLRPAPLEPDDLAAVDVNQQLRPLHETARRLPMTVA